MKSRKINRVFVVSACRTPIGRTAGSLSNISDVSLMSMTIKEVLKRIQVPESKIDGIYVGSCFQQEQYNLARKTVLTSGMPVKIPAATINRTCCSSMEAMVQGARQIMTGDADIIVAGGVENMSKSPHVMKNAMRSLRKKTGGELPSFHELGDGLEDEVGLCAEISARQNHITRQMQDEYACTSYLKAIEASRKGYFKQEIFPVVSDDGNILLNQDENIPSAMTLSMLEQEKPIFLRDGTITKLNATSINDGAAALVLMSEEAVERFKLTPMAEFIDSGLAAVPYKEFSTAPIYALQNLLESNGLRIEDLDLIEYNEAYAAQFLLAREILGNVSDKVNVNGGSIAIGHPVGCTGLRICVTLLYSMQRLDSRLGAAALCAGGGMGQSVLFSNC